MSSHRRTPLAALVTALALVSATFAAPTATAALQPGREQPSVSADQQAALDAIDAVRAFARPAADSGPSSPSGPEQRSPAAGPVGGDGGGGDLTMALRDVANTRTALSGRDREAAEALLRRPGQAGGDGIFLNYGKAKEAKPFCGPDICVHYVRTGRHAADPAYVAVAAATLNQVHDAYVAAGYREPKPDGGKGGNDKIDIYLGDIGDQGLYGYCTSDEPETRANQGSFDRWAYCVLDEDYAEFPTNTPLENLQVTVAHEYFHATQYAYDRGEDGWLLESTAAWVEDEMFDEVDDNLQYLSSSQLKRPQTPLDTFNSATGFHYGTWTFWRYLSEKYPQKKGRLPRIVLDVLTKADAKKGAPDRYSWQALDAVLRGRKSSGAAALGGYAVANRRPATSYEEGRANRWRTAPLVGSAEVTRTRGARATIEMDHLTTATGRLVPKGLGDGWKLRLAFDMTPRATGSSALVTTTLRSGKVSTLTVALDARGDAVRRVAFSSARVRDVEVTLVNGSGRFSCWKGTPYSCSGRSKDDNLVQRFTASAVR